ncbi:MAG: sodium/solute symporter [Candidatus Omnitrophota bacterium]
MEPIAYFILILYFAALVFIGALCSRKQDSLSEFFLAGRTMPAWAAMAAVVATETSAVTFLGAPAMTFAEGGDFSFLQAAFGYIVARIILALYFLPKFFEREIVTIYEFIGLRFGKRAQKTTGLFFFVTRSLAAGVRHFAAALVISVILKIDLTSAIIVTGIVSLIYSYMGGISAVIWTEVLQLVVMIAGGIVAFFYLLHLVPGGWSQIIAAGVANHKFTFIHWDWNPSGNYSLFIGVLWGTCLSLSSHGADQDIVQRLLACRNLRSAQTAIVGSGIFVFFQFLFFLFIGVMLFAFYGTLPPDLENANQLLPYFSVKNMRPEASALVIAAILSAALSSTASALNSLSSTSVNDFILAWRSKQLDSAQLVRISRIFTLIWTVILIVIAILASGSQNILETGLSIPSYTSGSLLAAFLLGIFTPLRQQNAIISGMFGGLIVVLFLSYCGYPFTWFIPAGTAAAILTAYGVEWVMNQRHTSEVK